VLRCGLDLLPVYWSAFARSCDGVLVARACVLFMIVAPLPREHVVSILPVIAPPPLCLLGSVRVVIAPSPREFLVSILLVVGVFNFLGIGDVVGISTNHCGGLLASFTLTLFRKDFRNSFPSIVVLRGASAKFRRFCELLL